MLRGLCLLSCLMGWAAQAQSPPPALPPVTDSFHEEVMALYGFTAGSLPQKEMEAKSAQLDAFWKKVKASPKKFGPAMRRELARDDAPKFFLYDGSVLFLSVARDADGKGLVGTADAKLAVESLARCTLKGIDHTDYLKRVQRLAAEGHDTTPAALHILDEPAFQAFIPQHALTLGQDYSLVVLLLPIDESLYLQPALKRLETEQDVKACTSLLKLIWYAATPDGDAAIQKVAEDAARPASVRNAAAQHTLLSIIIEKKYTGETRDKIADALDMKRSATVAELKAARRKRMQDPISDEALADLEQLTLLIRSHAP